MREPSNWPIWQRTTMGKIWHATLKAGTKETQMCANQSGLKFTQVWTFQQPVPLMTKHERICEWCAAELKNQVYSQWMLEYAR